MTFAAAAIPAAIQAIGSIGGGYLAGRGAGQETKTQRTQRKLVDKLIQSLGGEGPYSALFDTDESAFQKSFVQPAQSIFRNQIAPQIQQSYIAGGQQRGTGLDDQLLRAGVDLDSLLNQNFLQFQNQGKDRMQNTLNSILGMGAGGTQAQSPMSSIMNAGAGYLSSPSFSDSVSGMFKNSPQPPTSAPTQQPAISPRKGYEPDWRNQFQQPLGSPAWGQ